MADLSNPLTQVVVGQAQPAVTVNNLFDACSPAHLYGQNDLTTTGLTWGYYGGRFRGNAIAHGTIALPASQASVYIVTAVATGVVSQSTSTTNWNDSTNYMRLYLATTGPSTITNWYDYREWLASAGAGVATVDTETLQDIIASLITAGTNITTQYNDGDSPATLVINASGGALTQENVEDITASLITAGTGITTQYNDGDSPPTLVLSVTGGTKVIQLACSDETTALTTGTAKITFRMPYAMTLNAGNAGIRASLSTAQATSGGGGIVTVDVNEAGSSILSTKITIDNTEKTSTTAATAPQLSDTALADDAEITIDIDVIGDGTAKGLKVTLIGT